MGFIAGWVAAKFVTTLLIFGFFAAVILSVLAVVMRKSFRTSRRD